MVYLEVMSVLSFPVAALPTTSLERAADVWKFFALDKEGAAFLAEERALRNIVNLGGGAGKQQGD
jgi:hypothetical protein